ncbi:MAG: UbiA family prenyltransferase [Desulfuromonadaceae bacterium]
MPGPAQPTFRELIHFTRMHDWHAGKLPAMLGFTMSLLLVTPSVHKDVRWILAAYLLTALYLAAAYMLNNLADQHQDSMAHKTIGLEGCPGWRAVLVIGCVVPSLVLGALLLPGRALATMGGCYLLAWAYSYPPRFKERMVLGPFVAAFAQVPAPALTFVLAYGSLPPASAAYLLVLFLYGLRMILVHQLMDHDNDLLTGTRTTATLLGWDATMRLLRLFFAFECLGSLLLLFLLMNAGLLNALLVAVLWPALVAVVYQLRGGKLTLVSYQYIPLADLHESVLPLLMAVALVKRDGMPMISLLVIVIVLFYRRHIDRLITPLLQGGYRDE